MGKKIDERHERIDNIYRIATDLLVDDESMTIKDKAIAGAGMATFWAYASDIMLGESRKLASMPDEDVARDMTKALATAIALVKIIGFSDKVTGVRR